MTSTIIFDIETNGLLEATKTTPALDRIHCLCMREVETDKRWSLTPKEVEKGLSVLSKADMIAGHNVITFDIPAIQRVFPRFETKATIRDTLVMSRLIFPDIRDRDFANIARGNTSFPPKFIGAHGLMAWGHRISNLKGDYDGGWEVWNQEMQDYCDQDVDVTATLWGKLWSKKPSLESIEIEHEIARIMWEQEQNGICFDRGRAADLNGRLISARNDLAVDIARAFPPWVAETPFTPKRDNKTRGYVKGVTMFKRKSVDFNPNSRDHIAAKLKEKYDWQPKEITSSGKPKIDEKVLSELKDYPEAALLSKNFLIAKRLGQLSEGPSSWMKMERDGIIHGRVIGNGAVTGRMTHVKPNMNVPSVRAYFGKECRELFIARKGRVLVGCDADALELRCLAGYMAIYDAGAYIQTILQGNKDEGTDMHTLNAIAIGLDPKMHYTFNSVKGTGRDHAKTFFYAFLYGAGMTKLGNILGGSMKRGKQAKEALLKGVPALGKLVDAVARAVAKKGHLIGLDGRRLHVRSDHAALNTLLQSAGAILMKKAQVLLDARIKGLDTFFVATVHDEWILDTNKRIADDVGKLAAQAIRDAGTELNFRCPIDANYAVGANWAEIH